MSKRYNNKYSPIKPKDIRMLSALSTLMQYGDTDGLCKIFKAYRIMQEQINSEDSADPSVHNDGVYDTDSDCMLKTSNLGIGDA